MQTTLRTFLKQKMVKIKQMVINNEKALNVKNALCTHSAGLGNDVHSASHITIYSRKR